MRGKRRALSHALRWFMILALAFSLVGVMARPALGAGAANDHTVLVLGPTVTGGASSIEAQAAAAAGMTIEVVDNAGWAAKTAVDFASYRALIIGDPTCVGPGTFNIATPTANALVWGPAVNGRVIINGTDPVFHRFQGGAAFTTAAVTFVVGEVGKTSAYISLSCYYHETAAHTPVPLLAGLGAFTVTGVGCFNDAHIVASHPALTGITDATLSNWSCSVHEAFDSWPVADFQVLAIARNFSSAFTASDGTVGTPYILARGVSVISDISLAPESATACIGASHTLTATVHEGGTPTPGKAVSFSVIAGPNAGGLTGSAVTDTSGQATFSYSSSLSGTDSWTASFVDSANHTQTSGVAKVTWETCTAVQHSLAVDGTGYASASADKLNLTGDWTVEAWFKDETPGGYNHNWTQILGKIDQNASGEAPYFIVLGYNTIKAGLRTGWTYQTSEVNISGLSAGWHHVAASLNATTRQLTLYLDGVQVAQDTLSSTSSGNDLPVEIGRGGSAGKYWLGKIDDVRIWNVVRTSGQISGSMSSELGSAPAGLIANWKFDEAGGTTAADSAPSPADAQLHGGATFSTDIHP